MVYPVIGQYAVTETDAEGYTVSHTVNGTEYEGNQASGSNSADGSLVAFVNTLEAVTPTGVRMPWASAVAGILLAAALLAVTLPGRRWAQLE